MQGALRWFALGLVLESIALLMFVSLLPSDSTQPATAWQTVLGFTQLTGSLVLGLLATTFGYSLDRLSSTLGHTGAICFFATAFLARSGAFALPVWGASRLGGRRRTIREI
jgi:hypothetical protein